LFLIWYFLLPNALCLLVKCELEHGKATNCSVTYGKSSQQATAGCRPGGSPTSSLATSAMTEIPPHQSGQTVGAELLTSKIS